MVNSSLRCPGFARLSPAQPTVVYDTFWRFAYERQEIMFKRLSGHMPPWTADPILRSYKFTNVYRASDRVSQYLIKNVIYSGDSDPKEVLFRILLFKTFNKIETWEALERKFGVVSYKDYSYAKYEKLLNERRKSGVSIYSAAYIMASGKSKFGCEWKHQNHLRLIEKMLEDGLADKIQAAKSLQSVFDLLVDYPTIGYFLGYQYAIDINYSELVNFSEMEFVVPGPGAEEGISKCFSSTGGLNDADVIRVVTERQEIEFARLDLPFRSLFGRAMQLIDVQNVFCEIGKYARVAHPDILGCSQRTRIKQKFHPTPGIFRLWFPPKWGINDRLATIRC